MKKAEGIFLRQLIMRLLHVLNVLVVGGGFIMDGRGLLPSKPGGVEDTVCWMCQSELQNLFGVENKETEFAEASQQFHFCVLTTTHNRIY